MTTRRLAFASALLLISTFAATPADAASMTPRADAPNPHAASPLDRPMSVVWPVANNWSDGMEREYGQFVAQLGRAVSERRCVHIDECLRDPTANSLYDAETDRHFTLRVDCADLPYVLRAYFSFKRKLPFGVVSTVEGTVPDGRPPDGRYLLNVHPTHWVTWQRFATPRELLSQVGSIVHSGMYRIAPDVEDGDFYEAAVNRRAIRPGSIFYDPNGHVLVVAEVRPDGAVYLMDGHPDGSLTWKRFGEAFVTGTARLGGGFKNFRPQLWRNGAIVRAPNRDLPLFDGRAQFDHSLYVLNGHPVTYHAWVRASLAEANVHIDPVTEFREQVSALCRDVQDRADAVNVSLAAGLQNRDHPDALPVNIYGTDGDWEQYSTPSRDARLKASFRELRETASGFTNAAALAPALRAAWQEETARPECHVSYVNSAGATVTLSMDDVLSRLFTMSFDPYTCPERRWGAPEGSRELATCHDDANKQHWYAAEQRLRNRIDREYGSPTPLDFGPVETPQIDVRAYLDTIAPPATNTAIARASSWQDKSERRVARALAPGHVRLRFPPGLERFGAALAAMGLGGALLVRRIRMRSAVRSARQRAKAERSKKSGRQSKV